MGCNGLLKDVRIASIAVFLPILCGITNTSRCEDRKNSQPKTSLMMRRESIKGKAVFGSLYVNGKFVCYTLENREKMIPPGVYTITRSKKIGFVVEGVSGRTHINIEVGNYPFQSLGCIFTGTGKTEKGLTGSKIALLRLIRLVTLPAQIEVQDVPS